MRGYAKWGDGAATALMGSVLSGREKWCVLHGDCREVMAAIPDGAVAHGISDPPYEAEAHTLQRRVKDAVGRAVETPLDFEPLTEAERCAMGSGLSRVVARWSLVFCQVEAVHRWRQSMEDGGRHRYVRTCLFVKEDPQPQLTGDRPGMGWESIVVTHGKGRTRWNAGGRCGVFRSLAGKSVDRRDGRGVHMAQKPTELMLELVRCFTDPGEVVLDITAGSGTTGVAAIRLGRRAILVEREERHARTAAERLAAEESGISLAAARSGQMALLGGE